MTFCVGSGVVVVRATDADDVVDGHPAEPLDTAGQPVAVVGLAGVHLDLARDSRDVEAGHE